ncbi:MAG TPA: hypothetical protein DDW52_29070, partial [Planctomycetaceae bacterium]|nr:hypothetical protein [Planctomycetaceae bacterium]
YEPNQYHPGGVDVVPNLIDYRFDFAHQSTFRPLNFHPASSSVFPLARPYQALGSNHCVWKDFMARSRTRTAFNVWLQARDRRTKLDFF